MGRYALLILPSANRVYAAAAATLTVAELQAFGGSVLGGRIAGAAWFRTVFFLPYVLADVAAGQGRPLRDSRVRHLQVGGEPGAGVPASVASVVTAAS